LPLARVANHCHYNLVPGPAVGLACLVMIVDEVAPSSRSEALLVEVGEGLVLSVC